MNAQQRGVQHGRIYSETYLCEWGLSDFEFHSRSTPIAKAAVVSF